MAAVGGADAGHGLGVLNGRQSKKRAETALRAFAMKPQAPGSASLQDAAAGKKKRRANDFCAFAVVLSAF